MPIVDIELCRQRGNFSEDMLLLSSVEVRQRLEFVNNVPVNDSVINSLITQTRVALHEL